MTVHYFSTYTYRENKKNLSLNFVLMPESPSLSNFPVLGNVVTFYSIFPPTVSLTLTLETQPLLQFKRVYGMNHTLHVLYKFICCY